jgi:phage-related protein
MPASTLPKPIIWLGDRRERLRGFPEDVKDDIGAALMWAQQGDKHPDAKPMRGFAGASVIEIVERFDGDAYRAVYTVRFKARIYVLHCFKKKSKKGSETPRHDINLIEGRLEQARELEKRDA